MVWLKPKGLGDLTHVEKHCKVQIFAGADHLCYHGPSDMMAMIKDMEFCTIENGAH